MEEGIIHALLRTKCVTNIVMSQIITILFIVIFIIVSGVAIWAFSRRKKQSEKEEEKPGSFTDQILLENAKRAIVRLTQPNELKQYKFRPNESTGIHEEWYKDSSALGDICLSITAGLSIVIAHKRNNESEKYKKDDNFYKSVCEDFMLRYKEQLLKSNLKDLPWGTNWYQFSVTSTNMLASYLLCDDVLQKDLAAEIILLIVQSPRRSIGFTRSEMNAIYMAGPWMLAQNHKNKISISKLVQFSDIQYCTAYCSLDIVQNSRQDGRHIDESIRTHSSVVTFAYFYTLFGRLSNYFYALSNANVDVSLYDTVRSYVAHPRIGKTLCGLEGRKNDVSARVYDKSPLGIRVMPFARIIRFFTHDAAFIMRGQVADSAYFEADKSVYDTAEYWVQYRGVYTAASPAGLAANDLGFIHDEAHEPKESRISIPSTTSTTETFYPLDFSRAFVFQHDNMFGLLYHDYKASNLCLANVRELLIIDASKQTMRLYVAIICSEGTYYSVPPLKVSHSFNIERKSIERIQLGPNSTNHFIWDYDFRQSTITVNQTDAFNIYELMANGFLASNNKTYNVVYDEKEDDAYAVLNVDGRATIIAPALGDNLELPTIVMFDKTGRLLNGEFDKEINQYRVI